MRSPSHELRRQLTFLDLVMITVGSAVGSGIFLTPASIARSVPSSTWMIGAWVAGGVITLCGALTLAELGAMIPHAGGIYVYLSRAYGDAVGFLFGWAEFLVISTGAIAALSVACATYAAVLIPMGSLTQRLFAVCLVALLGGINVFGVKIGALFSNVSTGLKLAAIGTLVAAAFVWGASNRASSATSNAPAPGGLSAAFASAMVGVLWSYGGWQDVTFTAGEARSPKRDVPLAIVAGTSMITAVYLVVNFAYLRVMSLGQMGASPQIASDAAATLLGRGASAVIAAIIVISTCGTAAIHTMTAPRIYYAMAARGLFFSRAAALHAVYGTPVLAIVLQSIWAVVLILFWGTFQNLIFYVVFTEWVFLALAAGAVFVLRRRGPDAERPYRVLGYPLTPAVFIATSVWFVTYAVIGQPKQGLAGAGFLLVGAGVYAVRSISHNRRGRNAASAR